MIWTELRKRPCTSADFLYHSSNPPVTGPFDNDPIGHKCGRHMPSARESPERHIVGRTGNHRLSVSLFGVPGRLQRFASTSCLPIQMNRELASPLATLPFGAAINFSNRTGDDDLHTGSACGECHTNWYAQHSGRPGTTAQQSGDFLPEQQPFCYSPPNS